MPNCLSWNAPAGETISGAPMDLLLWQYAAGGKRNEVAALLGIRVQSVDKTVRRHRTGQREQFTSGMKFETLPCANCGHDVQMPVWRLKKNKTGLVFCGHTCRGEYRTKSSKVQRQCSNCGIDVLVKRGIAKRFEHSFCSMSCRNEFHQGPNNPRWLGGSVSERREWYRKWGGRQWMQQCLKRDGYTCRLCGHERHPGDRMEVHHKLPFVIYKHCRSAPANGMTVCFSCHTMLHSNEGELTRYRLETEAAAEIGAELRRHGILVA